MNRNDQIWEAALKSNVHSLSAFVAGAEWADAHPKNIIGELVVEELPEPIKLTSV